MSHGTDQMNRFLSLSLLLLLMVASWVQAREESGSIISRKRPAHDVIRSLSGLVVSGTFANAEKGTRSEIIVADATGVITSIIVFETTTMYDEKGHAITFGRFSRGKSVKVRYAIGDTGIYEARSIKLMKP
jgi:hypothetical protein